MANVRLALFILFLFFSVPAFASPDTIQNAGSGHYRISLIIGSPGEEIWETFGHSCLRVIDSTQTGAERDKIYNYGYFDATEGNIGYQFLTRRVRVFLDTITYDELMVEYRETKRGLTEQELLLNNNQKERIVAYLKNNLRNENRYYYYDSFFDNCTTRLRDMLTTVLGKDFVLGQALPPHSRLTFRNVTVDKYCQEQQKYWFGLFLYLFYANKTDKVMSNNEAMFLPEFFCKGIEGATFNGRKICGKTSVLFSNRILIEPAADGPFWFFFIIATIVIASLLIAGNAIPGKIISAAVLIASGLLGCFMLYAWALKGEPSWANNLNVLWALPTNIIVPFLSSHIKARYAVIAMFLIGISVMLHILHIQMLPLQQISLFFLALIWVFAFMHKRIRMHNA